jgi:hypothetical protein
VSAEGRLVSIEINGGRAADAFCMSQCTARNGRSASDVLRLLNVRLRSLKSRSLRPFKYARGVTPPMPFSSALADWRSAISTHRRGPFP